jgi:hypothetical protein
MRTSKSTARKEYETTYRELRCYGGTPEIDRMYTYYNEAQDCALESYDNRRDRLSGFASRKRRYQFLNLISVRYPYLGLPF